MVKSGQIRQCFGTKCTVYKAGDFFFEGGDITCHADNTTKGSAVLLTSASLDRTPLGGHGVPAVAARGRGAHAPRVALRRCAEDAAVLAAELRGSHVAGAPRAPAKVVLQSWAARRMRSERPSAVRGSDGVL